VIFVAGSLNLPPVNAPPAAVSVDSGTGECAEVVLSVVELAVTWFPVTVNEYRRGTVNYPPEIGNTLNKSPVAEPV
jgi:hypothetical protein